MYESAGRSILALVDLGRGDFDAGSAVLLADARNRLGGVNSLDGLLEPA
jgi:hypothetical protein